MTTYHYSNNKSSTGNSQSNPSSQSNQSAYQPNQAVIKVR